ncbi:U3 small nucleolar RNA-associated protein 6-domain-containing protein [Mycotypha africana]|uniref:U3 small nucleolar RNA-associated protein 6-domain-containing protein n=1 Tax=Mycotypha africana TaxID=64632 RepID=UPI0022FFF118|nr:U3 small nucleolar RNA-associated protein 6-domain-containing protein [Mycotypha africana]KAI8987905.1 U3 small nucleolar RNA-associated protein 6-domain-containing protein [Mycotypha africana]
MAEQIEYFRERMIDDLEKLREKQVFDHAEIKKIIKKRDGFEQALKSRPTRKIDFLRYLEYEMGLDKSLQIRIVDLGIQDSFGKLRYSIQKRIYDLFKRATIRFRHDVSLWLQYIDYARQHNANNIVSQVFVQAIQYHPTNASLWIMAAMWEYEHNSNVAAARILLQRAIRLMPENQQLWIQYFKLELVYVEKIKLRRRVLGIEQQKNQEPTSQNDVEEDEDGTINLPAVTGEDVEAWNKDQANNKKLSDQEMSKLEDNPILQGLLTKIVYDNAIQAIPDDMAFRKKFIDLYRHFSDTAPLIEHVYETIQADLSNQTFKDATVAAEAYVFLAKRHLEDFTLSDPAFIPAFRKCVMEIESALTSTMESEVNCHLYLAYVQFLKGWYDLVSEPNFKLYLSKLIEKTFKRCRKEKKLSVKLYEMWVKFLIESTLKEENDNKAILETITEALKVYPSSSAQLWLDRISLIPDNLSDEKLQVYNTALNNIPDSLLLWTSYKDYITNLQQQEEPEEIDEMFDKACQQVTYLLPSVTQQTEDRNAIKDLIQCAYLDWAASSSGNIEKARQNFYPTYAFFQKCIEIENQYGTGDKQGQENVEYIFDRMISIDDGDKDSAYLGYLSYLLSQKKFLKAKHIYTRACKEVLDKEAFELKYQKIKK